MVHVETPDRGIALAAKNAGSGSLYRTARTEEDKEESSVVAKRLYRSGRERILGGVAGGIAEYLDVDPTLVRLAWIILGLAGGFGLLAYIIAWIIIPEEPWAVRQARRSQWSESRREGEVPPSQETIDVEAGRPESQAGSRVSSEPGPRAESRTDDEPGYHGQSTGAWLFGTILVLVGLFLLVRNFVPFLWAIPWWPLIIIAVGGLILANAFRR